MNNTSIAYEVKNITKTFPGTRALDDVSFFINKGEILGLVGENGAGKSTIIKILSGVYSKDSGDIFKNNIMIDIKNPLDAQKNNISTIFQEINLIPFLNATENIYLNREKTFGNYRWGPQLLNHSEMRRKSIQLIKDFGLNINVDLEVGLLSVDQQQIIEIIRALSIKSELIVMDEPTSALTKLEVDALFKFMTRLKKEGVSIIYITHRLEEIFTICDRAVVLRDGKKVGEKIISEVNDYSEIVKMMVGRPKYDFPKENLSLKEDIMKVNITTIDNIINNVSFSLKKLEVLGIYGLEGSGRSKLVKAIFGVENDKSSTIEIDGRILNIGSPQEGRAIGLGFLPKDRKTEGCFLNQSVKFNISVSSIKKFISKLFLKINEKLEKEVVLDYVKKLRIKTPNIEEQVEYLSGGNQQKVILAKWLLTQPKILIFDEPTRGIDVGAKEEVYSLIMDFIRNKGSVILISSELPELLSLSDRIIVMRDYKIVGEFLREDATEAKIVELSSFGGIKNDNQR